MAPPAPPAVWGPRGAIAPALGCRKELSRLRRVVAGMGVLRFPPGWSDCSCTKKNHQRLETRARKAWAPARAGIALACHRHPALGMLSLAWEVATEGERESPAFSPAPTKHHAAGPSTRRGPRAFGTGARGRSVRQDSRSGQGFGGTSPLAFAGAPSVSAGARDTAATGINLPGPSGREEAPTSSRNNRNRTEPFAAHCRLPQISSHLEPCSSTSSASRAN